ncbi:MAG: WYL domain-containing protein [Saprospiraceae bacterium]|nr:WYL domain-containing protein [Saprospiraceae bacterium]
MPTNLHALIRYRTIDECLTKKGRVWTWEELSSACSDKIYEYEGVDVLPSRRTIMYDIQHMRSGKLGYHAPITYDRLRKSYFYEDPDFSIQKFPLNRDDLFELQYALSILKNFKGFENTSGIENIITKLEHTVTLQEPTTKEIIAFDHSLNEPGQQWLHALYDFIQNENVLKIQYQPFYLDTPYERTISPYLLKEYDNRWFLVCWDHNRESIRNFALDRLLSVEKEPIRFHLDPNFDADVYFKSVIGVTVPQRAKPKTIFIRVDASDAKYLMTKPLHTTQKLLGVTDDYSDFSIEVIPNFELESVLLSFGERLTVLKPKNLRDKLHERVQKQLVKYC